MTETKKLSQNFATFPDNVKTTLYKWEIYI